MQDFQDSVYRYEIYPDHEDEDEIKSEDLVLDIKYFNDFSKEVAINKNWLWLSKSQFNIKVEKEIISTINFNVNFCFYFLERKLYRSLFFR